MSPVAYTSLNAFNIIYSTVYPQPCYYYYLNGFCKSAKRCPRSHEHDLSPEMVQALRDEAKSKICNLVRDGMSLSRSIRAGTSNELGFHRQGVP